MAEETADHATLLGLTSEIVSAHVSNNHVPTADLSATIETVPEFQREVQRLHAKRSLTSLPRSLKRAWICVM